MSFINWLAQRIGSLIGLKEVARKLEASLKLGQKTAVTFPKEVIASSLSFASTGLLNMFAIQCNLDWVMPFWVNRQYDPACNSYVPATALSTNITHRNWTAIGSSHSTREPIVDPTGLLTPWFDGWSTEFWIGKEGYLIVPSQNTEVKQYLICQCPVVVSQFIKKDLRIRIETFVAAGREEIICNRLHVENLSSQSVKLSLFITIRPYNPEGISPLVSIRYLLMENVFLVNGKLGIFLIEKPARVYCSTWENGDAAFKAFSKEAKSNSHCEHGLATALAEYPVTLDANDAFELEARMLPNPLVWQKELVRRLAERDYTELRFETLDSWKAISSRGTEVSFPEQKNE